MFKERSVAVYGNSSIAVADCDVDAISGSTKKAVIATKKAKSKKEGMSKKTKSRNAKVSGKDAAVAAPPPDSDVPLPNPVEFVGQVLHDIRLAMEWKQEDVAIRLTDYFDEPVTQGYISKVERGLTALGWDRFQAFCHVLDVTMSDVMKEVERRIEISRRHAK